MPTKGLLINLWNSSGETYFSLVEFGQFLNLIDEYGADKILNVAIASYNCDDNFRMIMLDIIRKGQIEEVLKLLPNIQNMTVEEREQYEAKRRELLGKHIA